MLQLATPDIKTIQRTHRQIKVLPSGSGSSHSHSGEAQTSPSVSAAPPPPPPTDHVLWGAAVWLTALFVQDCWHCYRLLLLNGRHFGHMSPTELLSGGRGGGWLTHLRLDIHDESKVSFIWHHIRKCQQLHLHANGRQSQTHRQFCEKVKLLFHEDDSQSCKQTATRRRAASGRLWTVEPWNHVLSWRTLANLLQSNKQNCRKWRFHVGNVVASSL